MKIHWLHLSDIHDCDDEEYRRTAMYDEIVAAAKTREPKPHFVFITGDLAYAGKEDEYTTFRERLFDPLRAALPDRCRIFMVPGNHDVDRNAVVHPRMWMINEKDRILFQEVSEGGSRKRREALLPRFAAYQALQTSVASWDTDWLASNEGSVCQFETVEDATIALVGINTAWLCHDNDDWGKLTAGYEMVEAALKKAKAQGPAAIIVLGHHPLKAMDGEQDWSDGSDIEEELQRANALYLHGHLHKSKHQRIGDSLQTVLTIQAPSAFQGGDRKVWRNGILWGELDLAARELTLEPLKWSDDDKEYKFDTDAGKNRDRAEGRDGFRLTVPGHASHAAPEMPATTTTGTKHSNLPEGWRIVDQAFLAGITSVRPDVQTMANYFDGSLPSWRVALAEGVQPRQIVEDIAGRFRERHEGAPTPLVRLLTGAGGEGKSTALLQIAAALVRDKTQSWTCLHRVATAAEVPVKLFDELEPREGHAWIVALDDAENAGKALAAALTHIGVRTDIHLVLAAREADWRIRAIQPDLWHGVAEFHRNSMPGLDEKDALRIAGGWQAYGTEAMGRLRGSSAEGAAKALFGHANEHAARPGAGALLGALLFTRQGEDLKDRVRTFLAPLKERREIERFDLLDIYAMIAAMHAENQLYLSRAVLAFALGCDEVTLDRQLRILQQEAMLDSGETYLLTRHRRIAEVARDALRDDGYDLNRWYAYLARTALREFIEKKSGNPDIGRWCFGLAKQFIDKGETNWPLARSIAKALYEADPDEAQRLTFYAKVLRQTNVPGVAMAFLKEKGQQFKSRRDVLYEWSVVAGAIGDPGLDIWLAACSLADGGSLPDATRCKLSLAGLGRGFELLHEATEGVTFKRAQAACGRVGLNLPDLNATDLKYFRRHASVESDNARPQPTEDEDLQTIRNAVIAAADEVEPDNDPEYFERLLGDPDSYRYAALKRMIDGEKPAARQAVAS